jgi:hypothetical protein
VIQQLLLSFHEFLDSLGFGIVFILLISSLIFAIYFIYILFIKKSFNQLTYNKKVVFVICAFFSLLLIFEFIASYDIYPNLEPDVLARSFAENVCSGEINDMIKENDNSYLAEDYYYSFLSTWRPISNQFAQWFDHIEYYQNWRSSLHKIAEQYSNKGYHEAYAVFFQITPITSSTYTPEFDLLLKILLSKRTVKSKFLGSYERWRVVNFELEKTRSRFSD